MREETNVYEKLASLVKVANVMRPIFSTVPADVDISEALETCTRGEPYGEILADPVIVISGNRCVGWTSWSDMNEAILGYVEDTGEDEHGPIYGLVNDYPGISVRSVMLDIAPSEIITADTSLLEATALLEATQLLADFFVMDGMSIVGTVRPHSLDHPLFHAALLGLILEMEQAALRLVKCEPYTSWMSLPEGRRLKAYDSMKLSGVPVGDFAGFQNEIDQWRKDHKLQCETNWHSAASQVLEYTNFVDKKIILAKRAILTSWPKSRLEVLFNQAEKVRNSLAHGRKFISEIKNGTLADFVGQLRELLHDLNQTTKDLQQGWEFGFFK